MMKRHEILQPLSREHHETLILAQLLKKDAPVYKGLPEDRVGKIMYAKALFDEKILPHFSAEERMVEKLETLRLAQLTDRGEDIKADHKLLRQMFEGLSPVLSTADDLDRLGRKLEEHVRSEERIYFPLIEELAPPEMMAEFAQVLQH
jgi:hypothetical protein